MTFGAMAAWQAWGLIAGAAALAAWLFLRRLRPPRLLVASLLLWQRVLDEPRALTLWERIRRAVSLALTILIAVALALAIARPTARSAAPAASRGRVLIVLDSSWSMLTDTRSGESRWERGVAEARRIAAAAAGTPTAIATTADGLVEGPTPDAVLLDAALGRVSPSGGDPAAWPALAGADAVHFITDGATSRRVPDGVTVHSVFESAANVGITAFDVRPSLAPRNAADAYLEIANYGPAAQSVHLTITRGEATALDRHVSIAAGASLRQMVPFGRGGDSALRAHVEADQNALRIDDDAFAWMEHARPVSVTVVGQQTGWLRPLLAGDPDVRATFLDPSRYDLPVGDAAPAPPADLFIFDRWAPRDPPATPSLYVAPPADTPWLAASRADGIARAWDAAAEKAPRWEVPGTHAVVRGVDPLTFRIDQVHAYGAPVLTSVAQSARGTPLISVTDSSERRFVLLAFGPAESNLASAPGFPVLIGNAVEWLVRPDARPAQRSGLASFTPATGRVAGPEDREVPLARVPGAAMGRLRVPGLYTADAAGARSTFAVNVGEPQVSNTTQTSLNSSTGVRLVSAGASGHAWWVYGAAAAFALALIEWWTWQRRITV